MKTKYIIASLVAFALVAGNPIDSAHAAKKNGRPLIERLNASFEKARRNREARQKIREQRALEQQRTQREHNPKSASTQPENKH